MPINSTEEIIREISQGRMVVLMDDQERENEGDLVLAGSFVNAEHVNFMSRHGRGLICLTLLREDCERLGLPLMSQHGFSHHGTNFTVSIDAAREIATGISAADRACTIRTAVDPQSSPADLKQPGHVFPLMAHAGGVLVRAGHTEAGCDLARLAGLLPAAAIVEILNEDGSMARRPQLERFAQRHQLKIGTIADLIHFRMQNETSVKRVGETRLQTRHGEFQLFVYQDSISDKLHLALVHGEIRAEQPTLVRVHLHHPVHDLPGWNGSGSRTLEQVMRRIAREDGVVVILCNQVSNADLLAHVDLLHRQEGKEAEQDEVQELRMIGLGAQILSNLGVHKMRVMSAPKKMHALAGFDLEVVEYVG